MRVEIANATTHHSSNPSPEEGRATSSANTNEAPTANNTGSKAIAMPTSAARKRRGFQLSPPVDFCRSINTGQPLPQCPTRRKADSGEPSNCPITGGDAPVKTEYAAPRRFFATIECPDRVKQPSRQGARRGRNAETADRHRPPGRRVTGPRVHDPLGASRGLEVLAASHRKPAPSDSSTFPIGSMTRTECRVSTSRSRSTENDSCAGLSGRTSHLTSRGMRSRLPMCSACSLK